MGAFAASFQPQSAAASDDGGIGGPLGFIGNALGELKDIGTGLFSLVGAGVSDIGHAAAVVLPGEQNFSVVRDDSEFQTPGIATSLPGAIWDDLSTRYGPLLRGDVGEFAHQLYSKPVSFGLDALGVGSLAEKGAVVAGKSALETAGLTGAREAKAAELIAQGVKPPAATAAAIRSGLEGLPQVPGYAKLLPSETSRLVEGAGFLPRVPATNPVTRALSEPLRRLALTEPVEGAGRFGTSLADRAVAATDELARLGTERGVTSGSVQFSSDVLANRLAEAKALGLEVVERPGVAQMSARLRFSKTMTKMGGDYLMNRERAAAAVRRDLQPLVDLDPTLADTGYLRMMNLDTEIAGAQPASWATRTLADLPDAAPLDVGVSRATRAQEALRGHLDDLTARRGDLASFMGDFSGKTPKGVARRLRQLVGPQEFAEWVQPLLDDGYTVEQVLDVLVQHQRSGGALADLLSPGGVTDRAGLVMTAMDEARTVLGPDADYVLSGVKTLPVLRQRLMLLRDNPRQMATIAARMRKVGIIDLTGWTGPESVVPLRTLDDLSDVAGALPEGYLGRAQDIMGRLRTQADDWNTRREAATEAGWDVDVQLDALSQQEDMVRRAVDVLADPASPLDEQLKARAEFIGSEDSLAGYESQTLSPAASFEHRFHPLRQKYGAHWDETTDELVDGPDARQLANALRSSGDSLPAYFPFVPDPAKMSDYFRSRSLIAANIRAADPHFKRYKGSMLEEGLYERNPVEALSRRAIAGVRARETFNQMDTLIHTYGTPITPAQLEAGLPSEYVPMAPDLLFLQHRTSHIFTETMEDAMAGGLDRGEAAVVALEAVQVKNLDDLAKLASNGQIPKMFAVPRVVADRLGDAAKWAGFANKSVGLGWDTTMGLWRGMVLTGSPRWIVNNVLGNEGMLMMQGAKHADVFRSLSERVKLWLDANADTPFLKDLQATPGYQNLGHGFVGSEYKQRLGSLGETALGRGVTRISASKTGEGFHRIGGFMRKLNGVVEDSYRDASFISAAERQAGIGALKRTGRAWFEGRTRLSSITEKGFSEARGAAAVEAVNQAFGNYLALGPFERHVLRRFLFPFYGFYKHQVRLLVRYPFEHPLKAQIFKDLDAIHEEMLQEYGPVPEWLQDAIPLGPPGSDVSFLTTSGMNIFSGTFNPWLQQLNPLAKIAIEQATGRSTFTGDPFSQEGTVTPYGSDQAYDITYDDAGNPIGVNPVSPRPGIAEHVLSQVPLYQQLKSLFAGGGTYDTASLLDIIGGNGTIRDETGAPRYPRESADVLSQLVGFPTRDYNLTSYQDRQQRDIEAALTAALNQAAAG